MAAVTSRSKQTTAAGMVAADQQRLASDLANGIGLIDGGTT